MSKPKVSPIQTRQIPLRVHRAEGDRRMSAALSSATPVDRVFGTEILEHSVAAIDMTRAENGLPLLVNHDARSLPIGRVESVRLDGDKVLRGELVFSEATEAAREAFALVEDGVLTDVSISYRIEDWERGEDDDEIRVTRWTPLEASVVSVPADHQAGIGRSFDPTDTEAKPVEQTPKTPEAGSVSIIDKARQRSQAGYQAGAEEEGQRRDEIDTLTASLARSLPALAGDLEALASEAKADPSMTAEQYRAAALEVIGGAARPLNPMPAAGAEPGARAVQAPGNQHRAIVVPGDDARDKAARGMELALCERAGTRLDDAERQANRGNHYRGWSLIDLAAESLELHGRQVRGMSREQIAKAAIGMRAISPGTANYVTSDFPAVTENVITKRVHQGYGEAEVTWNRWASTFEVPDFKQFSIPRLSAHSDLPVVAENAAYTDLTQADAKETATLVKHGGLFSLSWEAILGDTASMFGRTAASMGEAAARTVDGKVYTVLTESPGAGPVQGPTMGDGNQLFDATNHNNAGTAALDLAGIVAMRTAMARQTDENGIVRGIVLRYIIVPEELRDTADNLAGSEYLPWPEGSPGAQRINTVRSTFTVIPTVRLTDANDWFGAGAMGGTVEVAFLNGNSSPALERDQGWDTDALHWKIRHPSVAYPVDWRALYLNKVA